MKSISDHHDVEVTSDLVIVRIKEIVNQLKKHNVSFTEKGSEDPIQSIDNSCSEFQEIKLKITKIK